MATIEKQVGLLLVTGCRRGEIMGLKWDKVDFKTNRVKIDRELIISKSIDFAHNMYYDSRARRRMLWIPI